MHTLKVLAVGFVLLGVLVLIAFVLAASVRILREYERGVIFRFGRRSNAIFNPGGDGSGPGLILLIPFIDGRNTREDIARLIGERVTVLDDFNDFYDPERKRRNVVAVAGPLVYLVARAVRRAV